MRRHPVLLFTSLSQHSQLGYLWLPTPHCAALVWLTGHHGIPLVTKCFQSNPYLGKQRISLWIASILSMYLCSHTKLDCNQLLTIWDWYLIKSKYQSSFTCAEYFNKRKKAKSSSHINRQTWISSHFRHLPKVIVQNCSHKKCIPKNTFILLSQKMNFKIAIAKIFLISASIIAVKGKNDMNKTLIMYVPNLVVHY